MCVVFNSGVDSIHTHTHIKKIEEHSQFVFIVVNKQVSDFQFKRNVKQERTQQLQSNAFYFRGHVKNFGFRLSVAEKI